VHDLIRIALPYHILNVFLLFVAEMVRAGAIGRRVVDELEEMGCDTKKGCPDMRDAVRAFSGRTLRDYYTEGKPCHPCDLLLRTSKANSFVIFYW
jgi:hypothetical protein